MGNVTLKFYSTHAGETRIDRTIIADSLMSASSSVAPPREGSGEAADAPDPNEPPAA